MKENKNKVLRKIFPYAELMDNNFSYLIIL